MGSHAVFALHQSHLPLPHRTHRNPNPNPCRSLLPSPRLLGSVAVLSRRRRKFPQLSVSVAASSAVSPAAPADRSQVDGLERCLSISPYSDVPSCSSLSAPPVTNKKGRGSGSTLLEKSKIEFTQAKKKRPSPDTATGGGGGDIGKIIGHGGGDGGDDDGDDDDYFDDFDEGDEGDEGGLFRRRIVLQELFDKQFVDAVLQEWCKTMINLPAGLRQAYEMGLVSSAQVVKYLTINARPTTSRFIARALPEAVSRAFIGRMLADPSFLYKIILESAVTLGCSVWWELTNRKDRIRQEWDLALTNILTATACNAFVVWSLAPCRSYGNTFRFDLQNTIQKLPNNIFEPSYPMREFDLQKRIQSFLYRSAQLGLIGATAGSVQGALSNFLSTKKEGRLSTTVPSISKSAVGYGAFVGLYANIRYQMIYGLDQALFNYFDVLGVALCFSSALRVANAYIGERSRLAWLGVAADPLLQSDTLLRSYDKAPNSIEGSDSRWLISKNAIISGLNLLGIKQGNGDTEVTPAKARRKRIVRKKVSTSSV